MVRLCLTMNNSSCYLLPDTCHPSRFFQIGTPPCYTVPMSLSPFPGMNPYLEGDLWMEFHATLASSIRNQLMPRLMPKYVALLSKYFASFSGLTLGETDLDTRIVPDVGIIQTSPFPVPQGSLAVMEPTAVVQNTLDYPIPYIEIRDVKNRELVTIIEILSPANKVGRSYRQYLQKRWEIIRSYTHLVEIDLLRGGKRIELTHPLPAGDYYAFVNDTDRGEWTSVWAIELQDRLPAIPVPLRHPDPYVPLDLQEAVDDCFRTVPYNILIDYAQAPPNPAMSEQDRQWVAEQVAAFEKKGI